MTRLVPGDFASMSSVHVHSWARPLPTPEGRVNPSSVKRPRWLGQNYYTTTTDDSGAIALTMLGAGCFEFEIWSGTRDTILNRPGELRGGVLGLIRTHRD